MSTPLAFIHVMEPTVSVVLVVRNGDAYIAEALRSVLSGPVVPNEVIVIDGQSADDTIAIASTFPNVTVHAQRSRGVAGAYNEGIQHASGMFIAFISHDDIWTENKLALQLTYLQQHPEAMGCVAHIQHFLAEGAEIPASFRASLLDESVVGYVPEALLVRREIFARVGLLDESYAAAEDTEWFARARDAGCMIGLLPETLLLKRVHGANTSLAGERLNKHLLMALRGSIARKRNTEGTSPA
ncbi:MAG: glycosyltransferase [Gemmatimonas sp.]